MATISSLLAREVLDSRGTPTVEAQVTLSTGEVGRAIVPSGASTGEHEALELRDADTRFFGKGVLKAVANVEGEIAKAVQGVAVDQETLDTKLIELDGTPNKGKFGANAILSVSLSFAWAVSRANKQQLFQYINELYGNPPMVMPRPMFNVMNGGKHAAWATDIQEYMVIPVKELPWKERLRQGAEIFHALEKLLIEQKLSTNVGNEGGFAPTVESNQQALDLLVAAIEKAGYQVGEDIYFGFDAAASEFFSPEQQIYSLKRDKVQYTSDQMVDWALELGKRYPVASYEDMLAQDDWDAWSLLTSKVDPRTQVVGDDLLVTNVDRVKMSIEKKACTALLVKPNQIGTLTETLSAMKVASSAGWKNVVSHRSGETEDVTIAHLAVGTGCGQIKSGAPSRGERTAKYNELIRIAEHLER